jgi:hypothetical protein
MCDTLLKWIYAIYHAVGVAMVVEYYGIWPCQIAAHAAQPRC